MLRTSPVQNDPASQRTKRFVALEWLRFVLGLYIVVYHTLHYYPSASRWSGYITGLGFFSTSTFFILSGFLLTHVYLKPLSPNNVYGLRESKYSFLVRRLANLYPIHIGAMLLTVAAMALLAKLQLMPEDAMASIRAVIIDTNNGVTQSHILSNSELAWAAAENVTLTHAWNPYYLTFNPPAWSISTLFFFYLTFPWLAPWLWRRKRLMRWLILSNAVYLIPPLLVIAFTDGGAPETGRLHRNPLLRLPEFMSGILLCAWYHRRQMHNGALGAGRLIWLGAVVVGSLALSEWLLLSGHSMAWRSVLHNGLLMPAQLSLILLCLVIPMPKNAAWQRWASRLGGASLPMFALHVPLYLAFSRLEVAVSGSAPQRCLISIAACSAQRGPLALSGYPLFLILVVAFCILFQAQFVVPFRRFIQYLLLRK